MRVRNEKRKRKRQTVEKYSAIHFDLHSNIFVHKVLVFKSQSSVLLVVVGKTKKVNGTHLNENKNEIIATAVTDV